MRVYNKTGQNFIKTYTVHLLPSTPHKSLQNHFIPKVCHSEYLSFQKTNLTYPKGKKICPQRQPYLQVHNKTGQNFIKTYTVHLLPSTPHKSLQNRLNYSSERRRYSILITMLCSNNRSLLGLEFKIWNLRLGI